VSAARAQVEDREQRGQREDRRRGAAGGERQRAPRAVAVLGAGAVDLAGDGRLLAGGREPSTSDSASLPPSISTWRICSSVARFARYGAVTRRSAGAGASRRSRRSRASIRRWAATIRARTAASPAASSAYATS
jgi:hypothetical protein